MKDRLMVIAMIAALLVSATSLVVSLGSLYQTKSESGTLPPEVFSALAGKSGGTGAGTFSLNAGQTTTIYIDAMPYEHTITGTVTNEATSTGDLIVTVYYVYGIYTSPAIKPGNSITGTGTWAMVNNNTLRVEVSAIGGHVDGYYFGSFFPG